MQADSTTTDQPPVTARPPRRGRHGRRNPARAAAQAAGDAPPAPNGEGKEAGSGNNNPIPVARTTAAPTQPARAGAGPAPPPGVAAARGRGRRGGGARGRPSGRRGARQKPRVSTDPDTKRLFVAVALPDHVRARLDALPLDPLREDVNVAHTATLHITVHYLGPAPFGAVDRALAAVRAAPFRLRVRGVGAFPSAGAARVLWAGVREVGDDGDGEGEGEGEGADVESKTAGADRAKDRGAGQAMSALYDAVGEAVRSAGCKTENRAYYPHVTVAKLRGGGRRRRSTPQIADFVTDNDGLDAGEFDVTDFVLYESILQDGGGSVYEVLRRYTLEAGDGADGAGSGGEDQEAGAGAA